MLHYRSVVILSDTTNGLQLSRITIKAQLSPRGAYLILDTPEGAFREGGLFKKLDEEDIYNSLISLLPHILRINDAILRVKCINLTDLYSKLHQNWYTNVLKQNRKKIHGKF